MKVLFLTNMPSYHQMELSRRLVALLGEENFRIVFHQPTSDSRSEMGWDDRYNDSFVLRYWESDQTRSEIKKWILESDVVIHGRFPIRSVRRRISSGKLTFAYQERYFKRKFSYPKALFRLHRIIKNYWSVNRKNYHLLAAGAYTAFDLNRIGVFRGRSWKFGYFIEPSKPHEEQNESSEIRLLWCARFSAVKQPEQVLQIAKKLIDKKTNFSLTMVGDGELRKEMEEVSIAYGLTDYVSFSGWQSNEEVESLMRESDLFLMTSNQGEGWGIVVNEAMSNACATAVNRSVGSAPWLIEHGKTGLIYEDHQIQTLVDDIAGLSRQDLQKMGYAGYRSIVENWSCQAAAERLITLSEYLLNTNSRGNNLDKTFSLPYQSGPCSPAS